MQFAWFFRPYLGHPNTPNAVSDRHIWASQIWWRGVPATVAGDSDNSYFWAALWPHQCHEKWAPSQEGHLNLDMSNYIQIQPQELDLNSLGSHKLDFLFLPSWVPSAWRRWENPHANSTVIRPFDPPLTRPAKCRLWPTDDDDWALCRTSQIPKIFCSCKWGIRSRWPSDRHPVEFGQDAATAYLCYV